jgi:hypothetical protein
LKDLLAALAPTSIASFVRTFSHRQDRIVIQAFTAPCARRWVDRRMADVAQHERTGVIAILITTLAI